MKAYEFVGEVTADRQLKLPELALAQLVGHHAVRIIVLVQDSPEGEEETEWSTIAAEQFLAGYSEADAIHDTL